MKTSTVLLLFALLVFGMWVLVVGKVIAHESLRGWVYPSGCCSGQDCHHLHTRSVKVTNEGYEVTIMPGEHPFVKQVPFRIMIPLSSDKMRDAEDEFYHICLSPTLNLRCFYKSRPSG